VLRQLVITVQRYAVSDRRRSGAEIAFYNFSFKNMTPPLPARFAGLDQLTTAVVTLARDFTLMHANPAAENLFAFSLKGAIGQPFARVFSTGHAGNHALFSMLEQVVRTEAGFNENELTLETTGAVALHSSCVASPSEQGEIVLEFHPLDQQLKIAREEKILERQQLNRELIRNLAHEIKNPLGGIRGSAQLLERELRALPRADELKEYTQVIVKEADRLQTLMDRLLTPSRLPQMARVNVHEVVERVRTLILAEFPAGIQIVRDYDTSLPDFIADKEPLIQALLNIARNAAQAMHGRGQIRFATRIARQVTLARQRYRHAIQVQIIDNGPGVPEGLKDKIFFPLVSGRDGGTGLGLSLAQNFVSQHHGIIECESVPGRTCFSVLLPVRESQHVSATAPPH
jgi:two-component system nitrogen regulation sensor histidine kinase GlnL